MSTIVAVRYHDISAGHRVYGHESKCAGMHGHNYRFYFHVQAAKLDSLGRVMDFSVIKSLLCQWLEENWDHKFLLWERDPFWKVLVDSEARDLLPETGSFVSVPFNPTAENMAQYFTETIAPVLLENTGCVLVKVQIEETRKCSAIYEL